MAVNSLAFEQAATLLNTLYTQTTGKAALSVVDERDFISVATKTLSSGVDPIASAIGQMVGRTIYSMRPYTAKLRSVEVSNQEYGYITRKLAIADKDWETSAAYNLTDGQAPSPSMFTVSVPNVLQTNFYGQTVFKRHYTVYRKQLAAAFESSTAMGEFFTMVTQNCYDMIEQNREIVRRATIANFMGGKIKATNGVIHLLTEYNTQTGANLTATTVYAKENFDDFCKWLRARIATLSGMMTERTINYQINITNKVITRHTPYADQRVLIYKPFLDAMNARVLADTFNATMAQIGNVEEVNFWQSSLTPAKINVKPVYLNASDGSLVTNATACEQDNIIGFMFDREALGVTIMDEYEAVSPYECSGEFWNYWFSFVQRWWNDFSEKAIVLILD